MRILLAVDGSPCSDAAVNELASRPWPSGSAIHVLSVIEMPVAPTPEPWILSPDFYDEVEKASRSRAESAIKNATSKVQQTHGDSFAITTSIITGSPKHAILEEAEAWKADLIIVGSHGYKGWERFLLGSVSQAVALHAKCSVEVVRCRDLN